jgi:hypothetical protein
MIDGVRSSHSSGENMAADAALVRPPRPEARARRLLAGLALALFLPALAFPLHDDDFFTLYWARASAFHPRLLALPWMGGLLGRYLTKLLYVLGMVTVGPVGQAYTLANLALHVVNVLLLERLARSWSGSRRVGLLAALLFAIGFGFYGKAIARVCNIGMVLGMTIALWSLLEWSRGRRARALGLWLLTLALHEAYVATPIVMLFAPNATSPPSPRTERWRTALVLAGLAAAIPALWLGGGAGRLAAHLVSYPCCALVPVNFSSGRAVEAAGFGPSLLWMECTLAHRAATGLALLPLFAVAAARGPVRRAAVAWAFAAWLPVCVMKAGLAGDYIEARHLFGSAPALCLVVAVALDHVRARPLRALLAAGACALAVLGTTALWAVTGVHVRSPGQTRSAAQFARDLGTLERTHVPLPFDWGIPLDFR